MAEHNPQQQAAQQANNGRKRYQLKTAAAVSEVHPSGYANPYDNPFIADLPKPSEATIKRLSSSSFKGLYASRSGQEEEKKMAGPVTAEEAGAQGFALLSADTQTFAGQINEQDPENQAEIDAWESRFVQENEETAENEENEGIVPGETVSEDKQEIQPAEDRNAWRNLSVYTIISQKLGLTYEVVKKRFREENGYHADFNAWIKKSIIEKGWTSLEDTPPSIHEIKVDWKTEKDRGIEKEIPYIEAYSYEDAFAYAGRLGLIKNAGQPFYWVTKIKGTPRKYRYNFSSREGYLNYRNIQKIILQSDKISSKYLQQGFFEDLKYIAGSEGESYYTEMMKKTAWNDRLLSNQLVKLVFIAQQKQIDIEHLKNQAANGIITTELILFVQHFKANEAKRKQEEEKKARAEQEAELKRLEEKGEAINGNEKYRRYYRDSKSVDVDEQAYRRFIKSLKNRHGSDEAFFEALDERGAFNQLQQDIFYLLTIEERKTALYFCANAYYLSDGVEEPALISILQNTPPGDRNRIKAALESEHGDYPNLSRALKANVSSGNLKELTIAIENLLGYRTQKLNKDDLIYAGNQSTIINTRAVTDLTPFQVQGLKMDDYQWFVEALQSNARDEDRGEALVNLIIYASSAQQVWLRAHFSENNLKRLRILKANLSDELWNRLKFGETTDQGISTEFTGQDKKQLNKNKRGSGLENLFDDDQTMYETVYRLLDGSSHKESPDIKGTLSTIPFAVIRKIVQNDEKRILRMLHLLSKGSTDARDENTIMRVLKAVQTEYSEKEEQAFYYTLKGKNGSGFGDLVKRIEEVMDDRYYAWRQLISDFNADGSKKRVEATENASDGDVDTKIAMMSDEDLASLSLKDRKTFISDLVGSGWWDQFFTVTGDEDENSVIRLINTTPHADVQAIYNFLFKHEGERFEALQAAIDGEEFRTFHETLKQRNFRFIEEGLVSGVDKEIGAELLQQHFEKLTMMRLAGGNYQKGKEQQSKQFHFTDPGSVKKMFTGEIRTRYHLAFTEEGKLLVVMVEESGALNDASATLLDPMDLISVKHERDDDELGVKKGDVVIMPAVGLFFYQNKADNRALMEAVDVALLAVSIATLGAASGLAMTVIGILEITAATSDILLRNFREELPPALAEIWGDLNLFLMLTTGAVGGAMLAKAALSKLTRFIATKAFKTLPKSMKEKLRFIAGVNEKHAEVLASIRSTDKLEELADLEKQLAGKAKNPVSKEVLGEIEKRRVQLKQQKQLDELDESLKKQQQPEVKEPTTKKVEEEPAVTEPKKEEPKSDLDDPGKKGKSENEIRIESGVKEDPLDFVMNNKNNALSEKQKEFLNRLAAEDDLGKGIARVGKREVTPSDLANLTNKLHTEFAVVMDKNGQRFLVQLESYDGGNLPSYTKRLLMHSHPNDGGSGTALWISEADIDAITILNQEYSYMVTVDGRIWKFTKKTAPNGQGELIRELNYYGWGNPKK